jgi:hypothetical protein
MEHSQYSNIPGHRAVVLALLARAKMDAGSKDDAIRQDAIAWLRSGDCAVLVDLLAGATGHHLDAGALREAIQ